MFSCELGFILLFTIIDELFFSYISINIMKRMMVHNKQISQVVKTPTYELCVLKYNQL